MTVGFPEAAYIWLDLLLPTHWPPIIAGAVTIVHKRLLNRKLRFFVMSCVIGYGIQGLVSIIWPVVWMVYYDKSDKFPIGANRYLYAQSLSSAIITCLILHRLATHTWQRLYPKMIFNNK